MPKFNEQILLFGNYTGTNGIYIVDIKKYEIIKQVVEGFTDVNTILALNENSIIVGGNYSSEGYSMVSYEFDPNTISFTLKNKKTKIHRDYIHNIVVNYKNITSCSADKTIKLWRFPEIN